MSILDITVVSVALPTFQTEFDATYAQVAWTMTGYTLALATVIPLSGWAADRFGTKRLYMLALVLFTRAPVDANYWIDVLPVLVLMGFGIGICFPALMTIAMSGATRADAGLASGLVNTTAQVGGAIGLAVLATLSTSRTNTLEDAGHSTASALTSGFHLAFWVAAGLVIAAIGVAALYIQPEDKAAEQFAGEEASGQMPEANETAYSEAA
jgi:MFS family permease